MDEDMGPELTRAKWQKYFAIFPVEIHGERHWMETVYRRKAVVFDERWGYEYGTILDVLKEAQ